MTEAPDLRSACQRCGSRYCTGCSFPKPFSLDDLHSAFCDAAKKAWDEGLAWQGRPRIITTVTLPDCVLPDVATLLDPLTREIVRIQRTVPWTFSEPLPLNISDETRSRLIAEGWAPPAEPEQ